MLYPTHQKYGQVYGLVGASVGATMGLIPSVDYGNGFGNMAGSLIMSVLYVAVCYKASIFGSEFPDIDSPGSIPARKHDLIQKLFKLFHVKHRGKFSHDFASLLIVFGSLYFILELLVGPSMSYILSQGVGNSEITPFIALLSSGGFLLSLAKTYVVFCLVGAYSHLIADASTKQGVWLFWSIKIHIVPVFITRIRIGDKTPFSTIFNTGTGWEMLNRNAMTYVFLPISIILVILTIFGLKLF